MPIAMRRLMIWLTISSILVLAGCTRPLPEGPVLTEDRKITMLSQDIAGLDDAIDPDEAARAAAISIRYAKALRDRYQVTESPLIHNSMVNMGLRSRGLCYHWADDIEARLRDEGFRTLRFHRAIANANNLRIEHSTVIVSAPGQTMFEGIVLDGWRNGGDLYFAKTLKDPDYRWEPRTEVFARKRRRERLASTD